jgi:hypothetical protein
MFEAVGYHYLLLLCSFAVSNTFLLIDIKNMTTLMKNNASYQSKRWQHKVTTGFPFCCKHFKGLPAAVLLGCKKQFSCKRRTRDKLAVWQRY